MMCPVVSLRLAAGLLRAAGPCPGESKPAGQVIRDRTGALTRLANTTVAVRLQNNPRDGGCEWLGALCCALFAQGRSRLGRPAGRPLAADAGDGALAVRCGSGYLYCSVSAMWRAPFSARQKRG